MEQLDKKQLKDICKEKGHEFYGNSIIEVVSRNQVNIQCERCKEFVLKYGK